MSLATEVASGRIYDWQPEPPVGNHFLACKP